MENHHFPMVSLWFSDGFPTSDVSSCVPRGGWPRSNGQGAEALHRARAGLTILEGELVHFWLGYAGIYPPVMSK